ncbi:MAG: hypothetical protein C0391_02490 [Anaerolinea sp.]|nr:hypothetical protein [Anaerolinea sp.]
MVILFSLAICLLWQKRNNIEKINNSIFIFSLILFLAPLLQLFFYYISRTVEQNVTHIQQKNTISLTDKRPDIYFIILDTYSRQDELLNRYNIDNSKFIDELRSFGFYIADCSLSNYSYTPGSIGSTLNMNYLFNVVSEPENSRNTGLLYDLVTNNSVRQTLEGGGYQVVAFDTGYNWVNWKDADIYYGNPLIYLTDPFLYPFETMVIDTTALRILEKHNLITIKNVNTAIPIDYVRSHIKKTYNAIANLKDTTHIEGPKFVYAHIMVPHSPYVFNPDGSANWENYFDEHTGSISPEVNKLEGYSNNLQFINNQIFNVIQTLINAPGPDPVIIIQGDHSWYYNNRYPILNAYYFPEKDYSALYPDISPVNSFRVVFNKYFNSGLPLLEDISIAEDINRPFSRKIVDPQTLNCQGRID